MNRVLYSIILMLAFNLICSAQDDFTDILANAERSSKTNFYKKIYDDKGNYGSIPISIIKGKNEGPVLTILSGIHGYEYPPIVAAQELIQEINPDSLAGTLVILPLMNPNAFYGRTPFVNPQDGLNLNRIFPGDENGSITERIASFITSTIIDRTDVFIDVHAGDANEDLLPFTCYYNNRGKPEQTQRAKELSEASGLAYVVSYQYTLKDTEKAKYAFKQAVQDGKVALSIECGKLGNVQSAAIAMIKEGVYNMLAEMEMYGVERTSKPVFINLDRQAYVRSEKKGIFRSRYAAGDQVEKGKIIGEITDEFGNTIAEITAPTSGVILYKIGTPPVNVGETLVCIGFSE